MFLIVRERTSEIGALKALGASGWHVIGQFWVEVLVLTGSQPLWLLACLLKQGRRLPLSSISRIPVCWTLEMDLEALEGVGNS